METVTHDGHPGFQAWNRMADAYRIGDPMAVGGETVLQLGVETGIGDA